MKKFTITSIIVTVFSLSILSTAHATVGGETLIQSIQYSPSNSQQIIYQVQNYGGKGCPPEIFSLSIQTGASMPMISCTDADGTNQNVFDARSENTLSQFPNLLRRIDLFTNKISVELNVTGEQKIDESSLSFGRTDFKLTVFQNGQKKAELKYSGCSKDQLHILEGYIIPNKNWMVLLVSTKADCFEGGYTRESLYLVPNITLYNQAPLPIKKGRANAGTGNLSMIATAPIVVQAPVQASIDQGQDQSQPIITPSSQPMIDQINTTPDNSWVYLTIIVLLIGIILIQTLRKR